jgi:hypothetical protein
MKVNRRALWGYAPASVQNVLDMMHSAYEKKKGQMVAEIAELSRLNEMLVAETAHLQSLCTGQAHPMSEEAKSSKPRSALGMTPALAASVDQVNEWKRSLRGRLFGLDKITVQAHLRRMDHLQTDDLAALEQLLHVKRVEHEHYASKKDEWHERYRQLSRCEDQVALESDAEQVPPENSGLYDRKPDIEEDSVPDEILSERIAEPHVDVNKLTEEHAREMQRQREAYERQVALLEEDAQQYRRMLDELQQRFNDAVTPNRENDKAPDPEETEVQAKLAKVVMLKSKAPPMDLPMQQSATADGLALQGERMSTAGEMEDERSAVSAYWGSIDGYLSAAGESRAAAAKPLPAPSQRPMVKAGVQGVVALHSNIAAAQQVAASVAVAAEAPAASDAAATPIAPAASAAPLTHDVGSQESAALKSEIDAIRHRYIVGKTAGEDLLDADGRIIIRQGGVITPPIIEAAERAGKLADLIVGMTMPGLGDKA